MGFWSTWSSRRLAALLLALALPGCGRGAPPPCIGLVLPMTGPLAAWGHEMRTGVQLALDERPEGSRPEVLQVDNEGLTRRTSTAVVQLVEEGATAILGPLATDNAIAAGLTARSLKVPCIAPAATGVVPEEGGWLLRPCASEADLARALARFAAETLKLRRVALVIDLSSGYSLGLADAFGREFAMLHGRVAGEVRFHGAGDDVRDALDRACELEADGVLVAAYAPDVIAMAAGASDPRLAGLVLLGGDGWGGPGVAAALAGRVAGAYHARHFDPTSTDPLVRSFVERWRAATGEVPSDAAALTYDAARALLSVYDGRSPGPVLREHLLELHDLPGVTGLLSFDRAGAAVHRPVLLVRLQAPGTVEVVARFQD